MKFSGLKVKVLSTFSIVLFVFLSIFSLIVYTFLEGEIQNDIIDEMYDEAQIITQHINKHGLKNINSKLPYAIVENEKIVIKSKDFKIKNIKKYLARHDYLYVLNSETEGIYTYKNDKYTILVYNEIHSILSNITFSLLFSISGLFLLLVFLVNNLLNKIINPIKNINKTAKELSITDFKSHIPLIKQNNEISELIDNFNNMIDRLKTEVEKIERFNSDVSHELKSPLTVINTQIELSQKKVRDEQYYQKSLSIIKEESNKINSIVNDLLTLTKINSQIEFTLCDFNAILMDVIESLIPQAEEKNINIEIKTFKKAIKNANKSLIRAIFSNILQNAIKYSKNNTNIFISLFEKEKIHFIVKDEGIGISYEEINKITDRFYRVDKSRNKSIKGFGLGLSIVKQATNLHNGNLKINSKPNSGTTVEIIL